MKSFTVAAAIVGFASSVAAHGFVKDPKPRMAGAGLKAACGDQVFNTQNSDMYGNVQGSIQNLQGSHPDCKIWQCKGVPFADKTEVYQYTAGQKIDMKVEIHAPHDGNANVSVVSTATDKIIGKPLISFDKYALTSEPMSQHPEWTSFSITMPDVSSECSKPGDCVIQWWWDAPTINQSYESCIDFTMGGGSGSGSGSSPATPVESSAPSSSPTPTPSPAEPAASPAASPESGSGSNTGSGSGSNTGAGSGSGSGSGSSIPKTFTIDTFVDWLRTNAGSSTAQKVRRMITAQRPHPRAFAA